MVLFEFLDLLSKVQIWRLVSAFALIMIDPHAARVRVLLSMLIVLVEAVVIFIGYFMVHSVV